jgi:hypothetical protein
MEGYAVGSVCYREVSEAAIAWCRTHGPTFGWQVAAKEGQEVALDSCVAVEGVKEGVARIWVAHGVLDEWPVQRVIQTQFPACDQVGLKEGTQVDASVAWSVAASCVLALGLGVLAGISR